MKKIIDRIADWLIAIKIRKEKAKEDYASFSKKGNNGLLMVLALFGIFFFYWAFDLYKDYGKLWLALLPVIFFVILIFVAFISDAYHNKLKNHYQNHSLKLVGFNMDFNERVLNRIHSSLTRYGFLDENLTSFADFYNVLLFDFDEHDSVMHFNCTQAQLKYILEKFKPFKKGVHLSTFERSGKIYNKGEPISSEKLSKSYHKNPPTPEFENLIDSFFDFLGDI